MIRPTPPIIAGRYRVLQEIGRGGMGAVFLVEHLRTHERHALKLLHPHLASRRDVVERFTREARASARIKSEHVVKITDADVAPELGGAPFLVMEFLRGRDLQTLLDERGRLLPCEVSWLLGQTARGLDKAHATGIVHRDLKPENLFLHTDEEGISALKILDFGIAKAFTESDATVSGATRTGAILGTPLYMAPEQARARADLIGPETDVWAIGLIALRLLTGESYWQFQTAAELMAQIIALPLEPPSARWPWLPPAFDAWFLRSCARDPNARFRSAGQQMFAFDEVWQDARSTAPGTAFVQAASRPTWPWLATGAAILVMAFVAVTGALRLRAKLPRRVASLEPPASVIVPQESATPSASAPPPPISAPPIASARPPIVDAGAPRPAVLRPIKPPPFSPQAP